MAGFSIVDKTNNCILFYIIESLSMEILMKGASIGVKLADRTFFPILEENVPESKELDITTVRDNQTMVQVNLYKSSDNSMANAEYIGTLIVDNLRPEPSGEPTVKLMIALDKNNELSAIATDMATGNHNSLSVSLTSLQEDDIGDFPDFSFPESIPQLDTDLDTFDDISFPDQLYTRQEKSRMPKIILIAVLCILIALLIVFAVLFMTGFWDKKPRDTSVQSPVTVTESTAPAEPAPPVIQPPPAEASQEEQIPSPPEEDKIIIVEESVVAPIKPEPPVKAPEPVRYKIKWGDTLWDIAKTYYKNPWLYPEIARANGIKNPDYIISGTWIIIPPR
ncbi:MAG: Hsp70 family protein [Spirochaetaceae bacterium]|jgi:LysM repeat protein|nr:Hsp70 family protein [Spirochaetaceae bacterium]